MSRYFRNIAEAGRTVFDGMSVSLSYLFRQPITIQYPDRTPRPVIETLPEGYRGILEVDISTCTACLACMRTCPVNVIRIEVEKLGDPPKRMLTHFGIYVAKCMFCGLCSEACPTGAIHHTKEFEGATEHFQDLVKFFVQEPVLPYKQPKKGKEGEGEEEDDEEGAAKATARKAAAAKKTAAKKGEASAPQPGEAPRGTAESAAAPTAAPAPPAAGAGRPEAGENGGPGPGEEEKR